MIFTGQVDVISNKATWIGPAVELVNDGITTDLASTSPLDIVVTISELSDSSYNYNATSSSVIASIGNGKVTVHGPGFQWRFEAADLSNLSAGTYCLRAKVIMGSNVTDLIDGTIAVIEGN